MLLKKHISVFLSILLVMNPILVSAGEVIGWGKDVAASSSMSSSSFHPGSDPIDPTVLPDPEWSYGSTSSQSHYLYDNGVLLAIFNENDSVSQMYINDLDGGSVAVFHENDDDRRYYFLKDHLGSSDVLVDDEGTVVEYTNYYPFGEIKKSWSSYNEPLKFTGKERDKHGPFDLHYFGARYYDPTLGRFTTTDPLADKFPSFSSYAYALNNPLSVTDPDGRAPSAEMVRTVVRVTTTTIETFLEGHPPGTGSYAAVARQGAAITGTGAGAAMVYVPVVAVAAAATAVGCVAGWYTYQGTKSLFASSYEPIQNDASGADITAMAQADPDVAAAKKGLAARNQGGSHVNFIKPDRSTGRDHRVEYKNPETGEVERYTDYEYISPEVTSGEAAYNPKIKYHGTGRAHHNSKTGRDVPTPHVHDKTTPGGVRAPTSAETPANSGSSSGNSNSGGGSTSGGGSSKK